jgi:hypothetical protein
MTHLIGAFFQCYKNPLATYKALESFRKSYPDSPVLLLSDNGYNYKKMAEYFKCEYVHTTESIPVWIEYENDDQYVSKGIKLVERLVECFQKLDCKYILLLEDDVKVHNPVPEVFLTGDSELYGNTINTISIELLKACLKDYPFIDVNKSYYYSGHGGSLYNKDKCICAFSNKKIVLDVLHAFLFTKHNSTVTNINQDELVSLIIILNRGKISKLLGHIDTNDPTIRKCFTQHQFKYFYNKPLPVSLQHLVEI